MSVKIMFGPRPGSLSLGSDVAASRGIGGRCGSDLVLLWLWPRPAAAAVIQPLAWELPYATGGPVKERKKYKL